MEAGIMSYFDLLFLVSVPLSIATLITAAISALRGRRRRAINIIKWWCIYVAVYMTVALAVDFIQPRQTIKVGDLWCFDHWCLSVEKVDTAPVKSETAYNIKLRIFNSSRRVVQRALNAWIYLIDDKGRLYPPADDPSAVRLDVRLQPQQTVMTSRVFHVPTEVQDLGLVTGHGGPYCGAMSLVIIGGASCLFNKPPMIRIVPAGGL
jgi:hypothetical protein